jgi:L-amino acid N-acyltransferase YncA
MTVVEGAVIRMAGDADAAAVAAIYGPYCDSTPVSFEVAAPTAEEMTRRIRSVTGQFPWLVLDDGGAVAGYAYATRHRDRAAYGWSVDTAIYVSPGFRRRGAGRALYTTLIELLRVQGYFKAYAGITVPNAASIGLHEALGFLPIGVYRNVGYKMGAWHDVAWYERTLQEARPDPEPPQPIATVADSREWRDAVALGLRQYQHPEA